MKLTFSVTMENHLRSFCDFLPEVTTSYRFEIEQNGY